MNDNACFDPRKNPYFYLLSLIQLDIDYGVHKLDDPTKSFHFAMTN